MLTQENKSYLKNLLKTKLHQHQSNVEKYKNYISEESDIIGKQSIYDFMLIDKNHIKEIESILKNLED